MLQSQLTPDVINKLSDQVGASPQQTQVAAQGAISALLTGLAQNTQTPEGADSLYKALDVHDGSILNNIMGLVMGTAHAPNPSALNGDGILGHILGNNQNTAAQTISHMSGVQPDGVSSILATLAPMVMGLLGQLRGSNGLNSGGLASVLLGAVTSQSSNPIMQILSHVLGGGTNSSSGLGGILGSVLGGGSNSGGGGLGDILGSVLGGGGNAQQQQMPQRQQQPQQQGGGGILDDLMRQVGGSVLGNIFKK